MREKSALVQKWLNEQIIQKCNQKYKDLEKIKVVLFTVPQSPPSLIELKKTIKNLKTIIKQNLEEVFQLLDNYLLCGYLLDVSEDDATPTDLLKQLTELKIPDVGRYDHQSRVFTKMLMELSDYVQFYTSQC